MIDYDPLSCTPIDSEFKNPLYCYLMGFRIFFEIV